MCLDCLRKECRERYQWPPSDVEDWDEVHLQTRQSRLFFFVLCVAWADRHFHWTEQHWEGIREHTQERSA